MEETKDVEINGVRYQIGKLRARDGSWVLAQALTKMLPAALEAALKSDAGASAALAAIGKKGAALSEDEFFNLQGHALAVVRRYKDGLPMPVFARPDTWIAKDLEYDLPAVLGLTIHSLVFNLTPFFQGGALNQIMATLLPDPKPAPTPA